MSFDFRCVLLSVLCATVASAQTGSWSPQFQIGGIGGAWAATVLSTGEVLIFDTTYGTVYNPYDGSTQDVEGECGSTACLPLSTVVLPSHDVLADAAYVGQNVDAGVRLYNPSTRTWSTPTGVATSYTCQTMTLLDEGAGTGRVLFAGGFSYNGPETGRPMYFDPPEHAIVRGTSFEYDPVAGVSTPLSSMVTPRACHTATQLYDGRVLVTGGFDSSGVPLASAEVYDPKTRLWTAVGNMFSPSAHNKGFRLYSGNVMVPGQHGVEMYDPYNDRWLSGASYGATCGGGSYVGMLYNGEVVFLGDGGSRGSCVYSPTTDSFRPAASTGYATGYFGVMRPAVHLFTDQVLVIATYGKLGQFFTP